MSTNDAPGHNDEAIQTILAAAKPLAAEFYQKCGPGGVTVISNTGVQTGWATDPKLTELSGIPLAQRERLLADVQADPEFIWFAHKHDGRLDFFKLARDGVMREWSEANAVQPEPTPPT